MCWLWDSTEGKDRHEFCESCPDLLFLFQYKLGAIAVKNSYLTCPSPEHQEGPEGKLNPIPHQRPSAAEKHIANLSCSQHLMVISPGIM